MCRNSRGQAMSQLTNRGPMMSNGGRARGLSRCRTDRLKPLYATSGIMYVAGARAMTSTSVPASWSSAADSSAL